MRRSLFLFLIPGCCIASGALWATDQTTDSLAALIIEEGSVARSQVVALGRDLVIEGEAAADVVAINGTARIDGAIEGDLIVLGGDAILGSDARLSGDVFVMGGVLEAEQGAKITGRSVSYPTVSAAWLTLLEGPSLGLSPASPVVIGAKLALLAAWLALTVLLFATVGRQVMSTAEQLRAQPVYDFFVGLTGVLSLLLTALFFSSFTAAIAGVPLLVLVVLLAVLLKLWGMVAVFYTVGSWVSTKIFRRRWLPLNAAMLGLLVLGAIKLIPFIGTWVWTVATLVGVGSSLATKFGRREPWFDVGSDLSEHPVS